MSEPQRFNAFESDSPTLARRLLGQRLVRIIRGTRVAGIIVETEAYLGVPDKAAHTFGGRRTARNESMYLPGGHAYVYFTYGIHHMLNVVAGKADDGIAVLIRAIEPTEGLDSMRSRRNVARDLDLCCGPGRLTQALAIDRALDGEDLRTSERLYIERTRIRALPASCIATGPRVGVGYAEEWAARPYRFAIAGNAHVSRPRPA